MYHPFSLTKAILRVAGFFLILCLIGWYLNQIALVMVVGALWLLVIQYWQMYRLYNWLWRSKKMTPPQITGLWEQIFEGVYYLQRRHRRKQKELRSLVQRFREGAEALPDAAVVVDHTAAIVWCNRLARIELGLRWPQDAGRRIDNLIRHPRFIEFFHSGNYDQPIEIQSPADVHKIFEYRVMPYGDNHLLVIARDVTRLKQLEQTRKDFVANVSHELRTPLTVLTGYLEMLPDADSVSRPFVEKALQEMSMQTVRMKSLVEQLLVLSRIESGSEQVFDKMVDVPQVLELIKAEAHTLNKEKRHSLEFDVDPKLRVYGHDTELRSAFSNLIFNAIHYTPGNGRIQVAWKLSKGQARFAVKDTGEGIAEKHLGRLTERFYRVDKGRSRETGGSGLGLAIVKHVLSHHYSHLEIKSRLGVGSEFSFRFPQELSVKLNDDISEKNGSQLEASGHLPHIGTPGDSI